MLASCAGVEHLDDVGVLEARGGQRLAAEAGHEGLVLGQVLGQQLDRHRALEHGVGGQEDGRHAAGAQPALDRVAARDLGRRGSSVAPSSRAPGPTPPPLPVPGGIAAVAVAVVPSSSVRRRVRARSAVGVGLGVGLGRGLGRLGLGRRGVWVGLRLVGSVCVCSAVSWQRSSTRFQRLSKLSSSASRTSASTSSRAASRCSARPRAGSSSRTSLQAPSLPRSRRRSASSSGRSGSSQPAPRDAACPRRRRRSRPAPARQHEQRQQGDALRTLIARCRGVRRGRGGVPPPRWP